MNAKNREEAWKIANEIMPTDYMKDDVKSERAGYPIYWSTAEGNDSHICDLNDRLEVNLDNTGDSINIWIDMEPEIEEEKKWSSSSVRECCIRNDFYTCGDIKAYSKMLDYVESTDPTIKALYYVAKDIYEHSEEQTIENVMFCLNKDAIDTFYNLR